MRVPSTMYMKRMLRVFELADGITYGSERPNFRLCYLDVRSQLIAFREHLLPHTHQALNRFADNMFVREAVGSKECDQLKDHVSLIPDTPPPRTGMRLPTVEKIMRGLDLLATLYPESDTWPGDYVFGALSIWQGFASPYSLAAMCKEQGVMQQIRERSTREYEATGSVHGPACETYLNLIADDPSRRGRRGIVLLELLQGARAVMTEQGDEVVRWSVKQGMAALGEKMRRAGASVHQALRKDPFLQIGALEVEPQLRPLFERQLPNHEPSRRAVRKKRTSPVAEKIIVAAHTVREAYGEEVDTWKQKRFYLEVAALVGWKPLSVASRVSSHADLKATLKSLRPQKR